MAPDLAAILEGERLGEPIVADVHHMGAAVGERATLLRGVSRRPELAADGELPTAQALGRLNGRVWIGNRGQQQFGVRMPGFLTEEIAVTLSTIRLWYITAIRSEMWRTTARSWAMNK